MVSLIFLTACKKEKEQHVTGTHIFWFDKATSDSLREFDVENLRLSTNSYDWYPGEMISFSTSVEDWTPSAPGENEKLMLLKLFVDAGPDSVGYEIRPEPGIMKDTDLWLEFKSHLQNFEGTVVVYPDSTTHTQLIWH